MPSRCEFATRQAFSFGVYFPSDALPTLTALSLLPLLLVPLLLWLTVRSSSPLSVVHVAAALVSVWIYIGRVVRLGRQRGRP